MSRRRAAAPPDAGFTLVEVLVALAITAIALIAGFKATAALTDNAQRQGTVLLAQICAENRLTELRLARQLPAVGDSELPCPQAERQLLVTQSVQATPNPNFRRVEATVSEGGMPVLSLSTIVGRN